jgi:hypothetical protein
MYFCACFLLGGSEEALLQVLRIVVAASPMLREAAERFCERESKDFGTLERRSRGKEALTRLLVRESKGEDGDEAVLAAANEGKGTPDEKGPKAKFDENLL